MSPAMTSHGVKTAFEDRGSGPPLVLLHGYPLSAAMWRDQLAELAPHYRVIAPDLRGHGATPHVGEISTMEAMAADVAALLDHIPVEGPVVLGGLSMGGYVALAFSREYPDRVRALVLADTRPQADSEEAQRGRETTAHTLLRDGFGAVLDGLLAKLIAPRTHADRPDVVARVRAMILATNPDGAAAALRGMAARRDQSDLLPTIRVPTLVLVGSADALTPPADAMAMHRAIVGSRLVVLEDAGHLSNVERPAEFNRALVDFLASLDR